MGLLKWAFIMLIVAMVAALFGFTNVAEGAMDISRFLFYVFGILFVIFLILGLWAWRAVT